MPRLLRLFAGEQTGPVILFVGRFDPADAEAIAPVAHHSTLPMVFAVSPVGNALDRAVDAGWRASVLEVDGDLVSVWSNAVGRGVSHVG